MVIDSHIHIGEWDNPDFFGLSISLKEALTVLKNHKIDGAVVMPTDRAENEALINEIERERWGDEEGVRLFPFMWISPRKKGLIDFLTREKARIAGLKIHPSLEREPLDSPRFVPFLEFADENCLPVSIHCGRWREVAGFEIAMEVAKKRKGIRFILGHGGGDSPPLYLGAARAVRKEKLDNIYFDIAGIREFKLLERAINIAGSERYLFASDFPLGHPLIHLKMLEVMSLSDDEKEMILFKNLLSLLKI